MPDKSKLGKDTSLAVSDTQPSAQSPVAPPASTNEPFPTVTSSGRMVTKTKKAAASTLAPQGSSGKKKVAGGLEAANSRSRSLSIMPRSSMEPEAVHDQAASVVDEKAAGDEDQGEEDAKLYCICRTPYDEDRVMIACDRYVPSLWVFSAWRPYIIILLDVMNGIIHSA